MKIHLHIDPDHEELEVHIYAPSYSEKVEQMMQLLKTERNETIPRYVEQHIHFIKIEDIYSIYTLDAKVYIQTEEDEYECKLKLYEVEENYGGKLVRVNKSTLVNIGHINSIHLKTLGNTEIILTNEVTVPVSRKYFKSLKEKLGLRRGAK